MSVVQDPAAANNRHRTSKSTGSAPSKGNTQLQASGSMQPALPAAVYPPGVDEYLKLLATKDGLRWLHRSVLRTASIDARELQAAYATRRSLSWASLRDAFLHFCSDGLLDDRVDSIIRQLPSLPVMTLARTVALQNLRPSDRRVALALYGRLLVHHGARAFRKPHAKLVADLAIQFGDLSLARTALSEFGLDPLEHAALTADLLNPTRERLSEEHAWVTSINQCLGGGISQIALRAGGVTAFDRLDTQPAPHVESGPKITVAITTWCPDDGFATAFRSIASQTWKNLEILVIDDHSPSEFEPLLRAVVATDSRARLIRMPKNGGTYVARNRALDESTGELFTVHDSDDWAHPQRIELQARRLLECPHLVSTSSRALRADDDLIFNLPGVSPSRENASSLMFRRRDVMAAVGYYDPSRKGADTEYALRMLSHFGGDSHELLGTHLAFIRLRSGSLSREEFRPGWRHPSRLTYRLGYQWHHANRLALGLPLYVAPDGKGAEFKRPVRFLVEQDSEERMRRKFWDLVYVLDLRETAERPSAYLDELLELVQAGRRVAVLHLESLLFPLVAEVEPYAAELQRLISTGVVGEVLATDEVDVSTVVVRDPSVLQFAASNRLPLRAGRVLILPEDRPQARGEPGWTYSIADVENHAFRVFGVEAVWVLDVEQQAACNSPLNSPRKCLTRTWRRIAGSPSRWIAPRPGLSGEWPRVGRLVLERDDVQWLWQRLAEGEVLPRSALSLFVSSDLATSVHDMGRNTGWRIEVGKRPQDTYFALLDVLLLHGANPENEHHVQHAMEAAASGCIVLGDESWRQLLGNDLLCHRVEDVHEVCAGIRASASVEKEYQRASAACAEKRMDSKNFVMAVCPA